MSRPRRRVSGGCHYCGAELTDESRTQDHIVPQWMGGTNARVNLVASCEACNNEKDDRFPDCLCPICTDAVAYFFTERLVYNIDHWPAPLATIGDFFPALALATLNSRQGG